MMELLAFSSIRGLSCVLASLERVFFLGETSAAATADRSRSVQPMCLLKPRPDLDAHCVIFPTPRF